MNLVVSKKNVYGVERVYPVCNKAKILTALTGNKTSIPERINYQWVDKDDGKLSGKRCKNSIIVPFINGTEPKDTPNIRKSCRTNKDIFSKDNLNYFLEAVNL